MRRAIRKHWLSVLLLLGVMALALATTGYILEQQNVRIPLLEDSPKLLEFEMQDAQAVQAGQGQTVRVAGVEVGRIGDVELEDGLAVVKVEIGGGYEKLIRRDASALLRPKTPLKDMFLEVDPGTGPVLPEGGRVPVQNTLPDIDPDEVYAALDGDTRPYLKLLVVGAGKGLRGRGGDLREVLRRLEPTHRDLARVTRATAARRGALRRLVHEYGLLMEEVGRRPQDLRRLVTASGSVFDALAGEDDAISASVAELPRSLRASRRALARVREFAPLLRSSLQSLRRPIRRLDATNEAVRPFLRATEPVLREQIRPFVRAARPFTDDLRAGARGTAAAAPDLTTTVAKVNRLFNIGAYNPGGAEGLEGLSVAQQRERQEGFLYWLAWTAQNGVSLFSSADGQGPWRRVTICGLPAPAVTSIVQRTLTSVTESNPALVDQLTGPGPDITPGSPVDQLLSTEFGSCDFGALPQAPAIPPLGELPQLDPLLPPVSAR